MRFIFYSPINFQKWDWRSSVETGIGGSETSHVEMCWRLARRGHEVINYAPIPDDCPEDWRGTKWYSLDKVDFKMDGVWVLYRCPETLDNFDLNHPGKVLWIMHQDWEYPTLIGDRLKKLDKLMILCKWHKDYMEGRHPESLEGKIMMTSNAMKLDLLEEIEKENIVRNPKKIMYASSPDRGLLGLLKIFSRAREFDPELELHTFYGFNNIDKLAHAPQFRYMLKMKEKIMKYEGKPGIFMHGRTTQPDLYRHWFSAGVWCYPTNFNETGCITGMEAQAMGAIPITHPVAAISEYVRWGTFIEGDAYGDPLTHARYMAEILRWTSNTALADEIRPLMMADARKRYDYETFVTQWIEDAEVALAVR